MYRRDIARVKELSKVNGSLAGKIEEVYTHTKSKIVKTKEARKATLSLQLCAYIHSFRFCCVPSRTHVKSGRTQIQLKLNREAGNSCNLHGCDVYTPFSLTGEVIFHSFVSHESEIQC